jgi:hypothetical protein
MPLGKNYFVSMSIVCLFTGISDQVFSELSLTALLFRFLFVSSSDDEMPGKSICSFLGMPFSNHHWEYILDCIESRIIWVLGCLWIVYIYIYTDSYM